MHPNAAQAGDLGGAGPARRTSYRTQTIEIREPTLPHSDGYARLYGPITVLSFVLTFAPLLTGMSRYTGNVYEILYKSGDIPPFFGGILLIAYIGLLGLATFQVTHPALPVTIAVLAAVNVIWLLVLTGIGPRPPRLSYAGAADIALAFATIALCAAHAVHLTYHRRHAPVG